MPKTKTNIRKQDKFKKLLSVSLTEKELLDCGDRMSALLEDLGNEKRDQTNVKAEMKARATQMEAEIAGLATKIQRKAELRNVECESQIDFDKELYQEIRLDTGKVFFERAINEEERQERFDLIRKEIVSCNTRKLN